MNALRRTVRRVAVTSSVGIVATAGLLAVGVQTSSSTSVPPAQSWTQMEHQARQFVVGVQQQQARVLNPREHEGHRPAAASGTASTPEETCQERLTRAWAELGHFSDGFETYLLRQPPCSTR